MAHLKTRTLLNHCLSLDQFIPGLNSCLNGSPLLTTLLNTPALPQGISFLQDHLLVSTFNQAISGHRQPLSDFDDSLITARKNHDNPMTISIIYYLYAASVLIPWQFNKGIYQLSEKRLAQSLSASDADEASLLAGASSLPQWAIFVSLPFYQDLNHSFKASYPAVLRDYGGFYAAVQLNSQNHPELSIIMVVQNGNTMERFTVDLSAHSFKDSAAAYLAELKQHFAAFARAQPEIFNEKDAAVDLDTVLQLIPPVIKILNEIARAGTAAAATGSGFTDLKGKAAIPHNVSPVLRQGAEVYLPRPKEQFFCLN